MPLADDGIFSKSGRTASCPVRRSSLNWVPTRTKPAARRTSLRPNLCMDRLISCSIRTRVAPAFYSKLLQLLRFFLFLRHTLWLLAIYHRSRFVYCLSLQAPEFSAGLGRFFFPPQFCVSLAKGKVNFWLIREIAPRNLQFRQGGFCVAGIRIELTKQVVTDRKARAEGDGLFRVFRRLGRILGGARGSKFKEGKDMIGVNAQFRLKLNDGLIELVKVH